MQNRAIGELIEAAGLGLESWETVISEMVESVPGTFGAIHSLDRLDGRCNFNAGAGLDPEAAKSYVAYYSTVNPWRPLLNRWPTGRMMSTRTTCPVQRFSHTEFVNDWLQTVQRDSIAVGVKLDAEDRDLINLHIHLPGSLAETLEARVASLIQGQIGALQQAMRMNRLLGDRLTHTVAAAALVARSGAIAFVVDRSLAVVEANEAAELALAEATVVAYRGGKLHFVEPAAQAWYCETVAALQARHSAPETVYHLRAPGRHWRITLFALPEYDPRLDMRWMVQRRLVLAVVEDLLQVAASRHLERALQAFGLTPAELRLCRVLAEGVTLQEAAERLTLKRETVRHRLKSIFSKTGTRRQVDLALLLMRLN